MKVRKIILGAVILTGFTLLANGQTVNTSITPGSAPVISAEQAPSTNIYKLETIIPEKEPVPYPYVREADVMWSKNIWRTIDLRQRMNFTLRYPIEGHMSGGDRYSLFGLLMEGIKSEEITPYEYVPNVGWKDPFSKLTTLSDIYAATNGDSIPNDDGSFSGEVLQGTSYIWQFMLQEQWFFDKKHSVMGVRIVALAPVFFNLYDEFGSKLPQPTRSVPFIVHFPQCRRLFATHAIYNPNNDAQSVSFDDLFFQRRFSSSIMAESNVYGNRALAQYKTGQDILLEADRIKHDLFIMEHDLWEY
ncbi:MAG: gliding motility protein GldN [Bacteroidota bacterium]